jgi:hypothetical protein
LKLSLWAASVLRKRELKLRERSTEWAVRSEPPAWKQGRSHLRRALHKMVPDPVHEARTALDLLDEGYRQWEGNPPADELVARMGRAHHQRVLMEAALLAGQSERAADLANRVLSLEQEISRRRRRHDSSYETHRAHIVLGYVALQAGDAGAAQRHLLAAADVSGRDPVLRTYGPDLELAQALLEKGLRHTVLEYLESWRRKRWTVGRELLDWWIDQISQGTPARVNKEKYLRTRRFRDFFPRLNRMLSRD